MKIFLDSANIKDIITVRDMGLLDGITTNPSLMAKENIDASKFKNHIIEICSLADVPVSVEGVEITASKMVSEAMSLNIHKNVVIKIPATVDGLKAVRELSILGIKTNMTLVFSPLQALLATKAGVTYVSPFVGRLDDIVIDGMNLIKEIVYIYHTYSFKTEVIVASIRNPLHILESAQLGADIATIPFNVINGMMKHPLTDIGIKKFIDDFNSKKNNN